MKNKSRPIMNDSLDSLLQDKDDDTENAAEPKQDSQETPAVAPAQSVEPIAEAPVVGEPVVGEPVTKEPAVKKPVAKEPIVIEDLELLFSFIEESQDHLETIEEKILKLEKSEEPEVVDEIFRSMHTMKGSSSFFGFDEIKNLSHSLESMLDDLRSNAIGLSKELIDVLLAGTDVLTRMISELHSFASEHSEETGELIIPRTMIDLTDIAAAIEHVRTGDSGDPVEAYPEEVGTPQNANETINLGMESLVTDEIRESFVTESLDLLDAAEELILELEKNPTDRGPVDGAFRCIHTVKGNAGFLGFAVLEKTCMDLENVLDQLRNGDKGANQRMVETILGTIDSIRKLLHQGNEPAIEVEEIEEEELPDAYKPLGSILVEMGAISEGDIDGALNMQERKLGEILVEQGKVSEQAVQQALSAQQKVAPAQAKRVERKDIRVDMVKLDKLFDLMGELITAEAMVINNPELVGLELERFSSATNYLSKITREMQEITMSVRMIPLEGLFNRMRRLVRDLTRKFAKEVDFRVFGQDTEMDRNVIEEIADPLMHIIRNAIDHGLESAARRKAAGKDETGLLELGAKYEGNEIWISIRDDGAGMNRDRIVEKAIERGLIKQDADLNEEEVWQLVFEPGFSTADQVSEVSGRGVGMDVVKRNVESLRGKIDIDSTQGQGTTITLKIPLTLAIIDGITARVGNVLYAIPLSDILEFHKALASQITRTGAEREVLRLREEIIPIIKVHTFFGTHSAITETIDGILIITQRHGKKAALLMDEIVGYQQIVVKALPEYLGDMRAISGCSILGNGEVSLIIDVGALVKEELDG